MSIFPIRTTIPQLTNLSPRIDADPARTKDGEQLLALTYRSLRENTS